MKAVSRAKFRCVTKPNNNHKFQFENQQLTQAELIEKVKNGPWKFLGPNRLYQRLSVVHHCYAEVVLLVRRKKLKKAQIIYDVLLCNCCFYTAQRIDDCYLKRWKIEVQFKYYKQHLNLGKTHFRKLGAIQSSLSCVALAGILVALYCQQLTRIISFRKAVKQIRLFFTSTELIHI
jgi:IS4 transposase